MEIFEQIINLLTKSNIPYTLTEHEPTLTSEDSARVRGAEQSTGAKAMVAMSKETFILLVLPGNLKINWRAVKEFLKIKDISLASPELVFEKFGLIKGSVPPFGNLLGIKTFYDRQILQNEFVNFNAGSLTKSINMKLSDLIEVVKPEIFDFSQE